MVRFHIINIGPHNTPSTAAINKAGGRPTNASYDSPWPPTCAATETFVSPTPSKFGKQTTQWKGRTLKGARKLTIWKAQTIQNKHTCALPKMQALTYCRMPLF